MKLLSSLLSRLSQAFKTNPVSAVLVGLSGIILVILLSAFVSVMFCETCEGWVGERLGLYAKNSILKFLGIGMGGVLLALQALMSYRRAKALEDTASAQAKAAKAQARATKEQAKANQTIEQGQRQERLKNAIEHLGHASDSVRLGGAYELFHLAEDTEELRQTVLDILCAHIRRTTGGEEYRAKHKAKPSEEIQSLLTLLFVQEHDVFKGFHINLQGSWLNGANLRKARLEKADLASVHLRGANLREAQIQGADLREAQMQGSDLSMAQIQGSDLFMAQIQGSDLFMAQIQGSDLRRAQIQGAALLRAQMQGADLFMAQMQGATCSVDVLLSSWEDRIRELIGDETDLSEVIFGGGLSREDVDSLVQGLPAEKAKDLRERLTHVGEPESHELPEGSGAITGAYTEEEAKQWIAEYNKAMSEVPGSDN